MIDIRGKRESTLNGSWVTNKRRQTFEFAARVQLRFISTNRWILIVRGEEGGVLFARQTFLYISYSWDFSLSSKVN